MHASDILKALVPLWLGTAKKFHHPLESVLKDYDSSIPPIHWDSEPDPIRVELGMYLNKIVEANIVQGTLTVSMWLRLKWLDSRLLYNGTELFGSNFTTRDRRGIPIRPYDLIWTPDIVLTTSVKNTFEDYQETAPTIFDANEVVEEHDGLWNVLWSRPGQADAKCDYELSKFPFDTQTCRLRFESWSMNSENLYLVPMTKGFSQYANATFQELQLLSVSPEITSSEYNLVDSTFSGITIRIDLARMPNYYLANAILPLVMVTMLSNLVAWLPVDNAQSGSGERLGFGLTLLLTVFATMLFTADKRPMLGKDMWLDQLQSLCIFITAIPIMETCLVMWLHRHQASMRRSLSMQTLRTWRMVEKLKNLTDSGQLSVKLDIVFRHGFALYSTFIIGWKFRQVSHTWNAWEIFEHDSQSWIGACVLISVGIMAIGLAWKCVSWFIKTLCCDYSAKAELEERQLEQTEVDFSEAIPAEKNGLGVIVPSLPIEERSGKKVISAE